MGQTFIECQPYQALYSHEEKHSVDGIAEVLALMGLSLQWEAKNKPVTYLERNKRRKSVCGGDLSINCGEMESAQKR